mmetsp:Transcript_19252/g.18592  ORF Transcript_19252/g.18592 Transcript_19252/m.18592 type:complete len:749 (-) Transcript_19252:369-2615(-)
MKENQMKPFLQSRRLSRGQPKRMKLLSKSKHMKRWNLRNPWTQPLLVLNYAAILAQKIFRGYVIRKLRDKRKFYVKKKQRSKVIGNHQLDKYLARLDYYNVTGIIKPKWVDDGYSSWCAVKIQSIWRMHIKKQKYLISRIMMYQISVLTIQNTWRYYIYCRKKPKNLKSRNSYSRDYVNDISAAAYAIQFCWRSFCSKRIFKYFSELVRFKLQGAPADLLRSIVPNESGYIDKAAGIHVRFRLGGSVFPPSIYFKIYTHRPVCDVNAFAPRMYSKEEKPNLSKHTNSENQTFLPYKNNKKNLKPEKIIHKKMRVGKKIYGAVLTTTVGINQWYKRDEKNSWRPIAFQVINDIFSLGSSNRDDINTKKKKKKQEWNSKAYKLAINEKIALKKHEKINLENEKNEKITNYSVKISDNNYNENEKSNQKNDEFQYDSNLEQLDQQNYAPNNQQHFNYKLNINPSLLYENEKNEKMIRSAVIQRCEYVCEIVLAIVSIGDMMAKDSLLHEKRSTTPIALGVGAGSKGGIKGKAGRFLRPRGDSFDGPLASLTGACALHLHCLALLKDAIERTSLVTKSGKLNQSTSEASNQPPPQSLLKGHLQALLALFDQLVGRVDQGYKKLAAALPTGSAKNSGKSGYNQNTSAPPSNISPPWGGVPGMGGELSGRITAEPLMYRAAIQLSRDASVEELLGNLQKACDNYSTARLLVLGVMMTTSEPSDCSTLQHFAQEFGEQYTHCHQLLESHTHYGSQ